MQFAPPSNQADPRTTTERAVLGLVALHRFWRAFFARGLAGLRRPVGKWVDSRRSVVHHVLGPLCPRPIALVVLS